MRCYQTGFFYNGAYQAHEIFNSYVCPFPQRYTHSEPQAEIKYFFYEISLRQSFAADEFQNKYSQ